MRKSFNNRGVAQTVVVMGVSILTLLVLAFVISTFVRNQLVKRDEERNLTREMAEYGMTLALKQISENPTWLEGFSNIHYKNGYYTVAIQKLSENTYSARSTGFINNVQSTLVCSYRLEMADDSTLKPKTLSMDYQ